MAADKILFNGKITTMDPEQPEAPCSMQLYNDVCTWIEKEVGDASIRRAGNAIGARAFARISEAGRIGFDRSPLAMKTAL